MATKTVQTEITLRRPWEPTQKDFVESQAKRILVKGGRRGGKTVGTATRAVKRFLEGRRQLYAVPTELQLDAFWYEVKRALQPAVDRGIFRKNESLHLIEKPGTQQRLRAKTAWNADTLRGDYADDLYLDEWQLMNEDAWEVVGAPMLLDNGGDAVFLYTPPSVRSAGVTKAHDPRHATKLWTRITEDIGRALENGEVPRWARFHFTSHDNPHISQEALSEIASDMSFEAMRREIMAEDEDDSESARLVYRAFQDQQVIPPFVIPGQWPRYVGHDFGGANPAALWFAQDPATGYFYAYREYFPGKGLSTYQHVQAFKEWASGVTVLKRVGGSHQEDEIRQGYTAQGWPISEPKILNVNARIDRVRAIMEKNQLFVFNTLLRFREEVATYLWKVDMDGRITDDLQNKSAFHLMDAMAYVLSDFTPELVEGMETIVRAPRSWSGARAY